MTKRLVVAALALWMSTAAMAADIFNFTDTWNNGATVFNAIGVNVTDTASDSNSLLMNLRVGGVTQFSVRKDGAVLSPTLVTPSLGVATGTSLSLGGATIGTNALAVTGTGNISGALTLGTSGILIGGTNSIDLRNGTSAQTFSVYNTSSAANANYERMSLIWAGNNAILFVDKAGTGATRDLWLQGYGNILIAPGNSNIFQFNSSGLVANSDAVGYFLGATASVALKYNSSGVAEVDSGTLGQYRDLVVRWLPNAGQSRVSTQFDATSNTTVANITGLSVTAIAGKTYQFSALLYTTSNIAGGVKVAIAGTATATAITYDTEIIDAGLITQPTRAVALAAAGGVTAVTAALVKINGTITVNAGGTLTVQFAQNASNVVASSVLVGSTFIVQQF